MAGKYYTICIFTRFDGLMSPAVTLVLNLVNKRESEKRGMQRQIFEDQDDPRLIKSHLHYPLLPRDVSRKGSKVSVEKSYCVYISV